MRITFDVATRALSFDASGAQPWGGDLEAALERHGQRLPITALSFGITMRRDGVEAFTGSWPPAGTKYTATDQDVLTVQRLRWASDEAVEIDVWLSVAGVLHEATYSLTAPRPVQPHASWTWSDGAWTAPEARPESGAHYWDEDSYQAGAGGWVAYE